MDVHRKSSNPDVLEEVKSKLRLQSSQAKKRGKTSVVWRQSGLVV